MVGEDAIALFLDPGLRRDDVARATGLTNLIPAQAGWYRETTTLTTIIPAQAGLHQEATGLTTVIPAQAGIHLVWLNLPQVVTQ